jgi:hypothetical protein
MLSTSSGQKMFSKDVVDRFFLNVGSDLPDYKFSFPGAQFCSYSQREAIESIRSAYTIAGRQCFVYIHTVDVLNRLILKSC